jgi:hypothetical protein
MGAQMMALRATPGIARAIPATNTEEGTAMASKEIEDFQKQALDMFRAQQEAYLNAVKAWREAMTAAATPPPATPTPAPQFDHMLTPVEIAEASYTFASKLLADQSRFLEELGRAMAAVPGAPKSKKGA